MQVYVCRKRFLVRRDGEWQVLLEVTMAIRRGERVSAFSLSETTEYVRSWKLLADTVDIYRMISSGNIPLHSFLNTERV